MKKVNTIILGAGPAGLSLANSLLERGEHSFVVFEKETSCGGLCRSEMIDGAPLDIGGGHFLDVRRPEVTEYLRRFLPEDEWNTHDRRSSIKVRGAEIDYPFEANLWQFSQETQLDYLESIAKAGCIRGEPMPTEFREWVTWKLGERIAEDYMIPYNEKMWSLGDLNTLGTYWLYKLPDVSFRDTLQSCMERRLVAKMPGHARFFYPRTEGYGHVWRLMGAALGSTLLVDHAPSHIDVNALQVDEYRADRIVTTIPWCEFASVATDVPTAIRHDIDALAYSSIEVGYHPENVESKAHWIYDPDPDISHHRLLLRHNFCPGARGYWTETNAKRAVGNAEWTYTNEYAYPLNLRDKPERVARIREWGEHHRIIGLGRWGQWEHMNSDAVVEASMALARTLVAEA